jgi:hypothetical protein
MVFDIRSTTHAIIMSAFFKFDILPIIGQKNDELLLVKGIPSIFQINSNISGKLLSRRDFAMMEIAIPKL